MTHSQPMWLKGRWLHWLLVGLLLLTFMIPRPASAAVCTYIVQGGDTLGAIASRNGTSVGAIVGTNPAITNPNRIFVGQVITLPDCTTDEAPPATQAPATQAPATQAPATQAPATQAPATQAPAPTPVPQEVAPVPTAPADIAPAPAATEVIIEVIIEEAPAQQPEAPTAPVEAPAVSTVPPPVEDAPAPAPTVEAPPEQPAVGSNPPPAEEQAPAPPPRPSSRAPKTVPAQPNDLPAAIWQQVHDATINIRHPIDEPLYSGSGIMVGTDGRTFLTAFHVVGNPATGFFTPLVSIGPFADWKYTAEVIAADPGLDLAILRVREQDFPGFAVAPLGNSDELDETSPIYTFSYPGTQAELISTKGHFLKSVASIRYRTSLILTDADATFGSSGGVAVNERGEVIGIITAGVMNPRIIENLGFIGLDQATLLVPINAAEKMLQETGLIQ